LGTKFKRAIMINFFAITVDEKDILIVSDKYDSDCPRPEWTLRNVYTNGIECYYVPQDVFDYFLTMRR
jgi:hypothetical protein